MPKEEKTLIMKFGGASIKTPENFSLIADLIIERSLAYSQIAIVMSAMGGMTDHLVALAKQIHPNPPRREYDMLVSAGERMSIALLAMALAAKGKEAVSFTGSQTGIITSKDHAEARILAVRPFRLLPHLAEGKCVIVAGFQGVSEDKEITTLGRGGSDTTAVALAIALNAEKVEFYKDVEGVYEKDPKSASDVTFYHRLSYEEAEKIICNSGGKILHPRALRLAAKNSLPLHVRSFCSKEGRGTFISGTSLKPHEALYEGQQLEDPASSL